MIEPGRILRRIVKVDQPSHALKGDALDQRVEQLAPYHLGPVLHLEQVVQRVRDRKHRIVPEAVVGAVLRWVGPGTR
eukprot:813899-Prymnesium_polylepis.3